MGQIDAFEHQRQLRQAERAGDNAGIGLNGKPKCSGFQTFIIQAVAAAVPEQDFYSVAVAVEEHEQVAGQGILADDA